MSVTFLQPLTDWLTRFLQPAPAVALNPALACDVDPAPLKRQLQIEQRARAAAQQELPPTEMTTLDSDQREIIAEVDARVRQLNSHYDQKLRHYDSERQRIDLTTHQVAIEHTAEQARLELQGMTTRNRPVLERDKTIVQDYRDAYHRFRKRHRREVEANYPPSRSLTYGVLLIILVLESMFNAFFFAQGSSLGLLGGLLQALLFSLVNLAFAFVVTANLWRWTNHVDRHWRYIGYTSVVLALLLSLLLNLGIAHYRDLYPLQLDNTLVAAWMRLWRVPFELSQSGWLLCLVGVLLSFVAIRKGYHADDDYPGYGRQQRRFYAALQSYFDQIDALTAQNDALQQQALKTLEREQQRADHMFKNLSFIYSNRPALSRSYADCYASYQQLLTLLISDYRDHNRRHRTTPPPVTFMEPVTLSQAPLVLESPADERYRQQQQIYAQLPQQLATVRSEIRRLASDNVMQLQTISASLQDSYQQLKQRSDL